MGWVFAIGLAAFAFISLWLSGRCSRQALELVAVALLVAISGYAWQGSPSIPGNPVATDNRLP